MQSGTKSQTGGNFLLAPTVLQGLSLLSHAALGKYSILLLVDNNTKDDVTRQPFRRPLGNPGPWAG